MSNAINEVAAQKSELVRQARELNRALGSLPEAAPETEVVALRKAIAAVQAKIAAL